MKNLTMLLGSVALSLALIGSATGEDASSLRRRLLQDRESFVSLGTSSVTQARALIAVLKEVVDNPDAHADKQTFAADWLSQLTSALPIQEAVAHLDTAIEVKPEAAIPGPIIQYPICDRYLANAPHKITPRILHQVGLGRDATYLKRAARVLVAEWSTKRTALAVVTAWLADRGESLDRYAGLISLLKKR